MEENEAYKPPWGELQITTVNPTYYISQFRDNPTLRIENSYHRPLSLQNIIKFKGASLFHVKDAKILSRRFSNFNATEFHW